jgi:hypothetical protein
MQNASNYKGDKAGSRWIYVLRFSTSIFSSNYRKPQITGIPGNVIQTGDCFDLCSKWPLRWSVVCMPRSSGVLQKMASGLWKQSGSVWRAGQRELCVITLLSRGMIECPKTIGAISKFWTPEGWHHVWYWRYPKITELGVAVQNIFSPSDLAPEFGASLIMTRF